MNGNLPLKIYVYVPDWYHLARLMDALARVIWAGVAVEKLSGVKEVSEVLNNPFNNFPVIVYDYQNKLAHFLQKIQLTKLVVYILGDINPFGKTPKQVVTLEFTELRQTPDSLISLLTKK